MKKYLVTIYLLIFINSVSFAQSDEIVINSIILRYHRVLSRESEELKINLYERTVDYFYQKYSPNNSIEKKKTIKMSKRKLIDLLQPIMKVNFKTLCPIIEDSATLVQVDGGTIALEFIYPENEKSNYEFCISSAPKELLEFYKKLKKNIRHI